ncbi:uncharacterized protein B0P05DRAFT_475027, partial [Gilbertella persicaria]|uniref:uncharacterized protein n=1 Tax=Gilbertella persicaria TaxID=101096 RepID=UPI0022208EFD
MVKKAPYLLISNTLYSPAECPFSCRYTSSPCCPFIGEPVCEPTCYTFAPCEVTPCPADCPYDCFYPNADYCCPQSGQAVCRN